MCPLSEREKKILHALVRGRGKRVNCHACPLTERERQVLHFVAMGETVNKIAARLCLAAPTVANHWKRICRKLDTDTTTLLMAFTTRRQFC